MTTRSDRCLGASAESKRAEARMMGCAEVVVVLVLTVAVLPREVRAMQERPVVGAALVPVAHIEDRTAIAFGDVAAAKVAPTLARREGALAVVLLRTPMTYKKYPDDVEKEKKMP